MNGLVQCSMLTSVSSFCEVICALSETSLGCSPIVITHIDKEQTLMNSGLLSKFNYGSSVPKC